MSRSLKDSLRRAMESRKTQPTEADGAEQQPTHIPTPLLAEPKAVEPKKPSFATLDSVLPSKSDEAVDDPDTDPEKILLQDLSGLEQAFVPLERRNFQDAGIEEGMVEVLILKQLMVTPTALGMEIAKAVCLRPKPVLALLQDMKQRKLVQHRSSTSTGDFLYALTEAGVARADDAMGRSRYVGAAPVPLEQYVESVRAQSIAKEIVHMSDLKEAFSDLTVSDTLLHELGPAMVGGKGMFMYGNPGNGKTSLAERITRAYGSTVFIPWSIAVGGQIIRLYDPVIHERVPLPRELAEIRLDHRFVLCKRPTVVVGGELTLESLELDYNESAGTCEAPIQLKANCGTLVIDDFGRQRVDPAQLLNRWIVPLEQRKDYLSLPDGRKVSFPFDPLIIFSTNLEPEDLVDEAFLRRIPYKICVPDPDETAFRRIFVAVAGQLGFQFGREVIDYLVLNHYRTNNREMRACHPRDLLLQVKNQCLFKEQPLVVTPEAIDEAARLYFSVFGGTAAKGAG
jgi:hypothetical protein